MALILRYSTSNNLESDGLLNQHWKQMNNFFDDDVDNDDDPEYDVEADAEEENNIDEDGNTFDRRLNMSLFA